MGLQSSFLQNVSEELVPLYAQLEMDILSDVARRIAKTGTLTDTARWQMKKARELGILNREASRLVASITGTSQRTLRRIFNEVCLDAIEADDSIYKAAGVSLVPLTAAPQFAQTVLAGIENTNGLFANFTRTTVNSAGMIYQQAMDRAYMQVISGAFTFDEALRQAITTIAANSIEKLTYESGSVASAEAAARRSLMTGLNQTTAKLQLMRADEAGCDLVEVTAHLGARPSHAVWQGKVYSRSGKDSAYPNFYDATGYGTGQGLCGWNCYHSFFPYYKGLSSPSSGWSNSYSLRENEQVYENLQIQRRYERAIRASKKEVSVLDAAMKSASSSQLKEALHKDFTRASVTLNNRRRRLESFLEETGLSESRGRTYVPGFSQSTSSKAVWAARKAK